MKFFIKKYSTLPYLIYDLEDISKKYEISQNHWENAVATFSMFDKKNKIYRIANNHAEIIGNENNNIYAESSKHYKLRYKFNSKETSKIGDYFGEFKVDFFNSHHIGKLTIPIATGIDVIIKDSITRTNLSSELLILNNKIWYYGILKIPEGLVNIPTAEHIDLLNGVEVNDQNPKNNITIEYNSTPQDFIWFAIPEEFPIKTKWEVSLLNSGNIGGPVTINGNLFPDPVIIEYNGVNYNLYISNYRTTVNTITIKNL
jgi:hypothetical protein